MTGDELNESMADYFGMWRGVVVDVADPLKRGRVRVKIFGYMDEITTKQYKCIPWAVPCTALSSGGATCGSFAVPNVGTNVYGFFEGGKHMYPIYIGVAVDGVSNVPAFAATNYPQRKGVEFANGVFVYNDESNNTVQFTHPSGTTATIVNDGSVTVRVAKNCTVNVDEDCTVNVVEDCTINAKNVTVNGSQTIHATTAELIATSTGPATINGQNVTINGSQTIQATTASLNATSTGTATIAATGAVTITGATISLN